MTTAQAIKKYNLQLACKVNDFFKGCDDMYINTIENENYIIHYTLDFFGNVPFLTIEKDNKHKLVTRNGFTAFARTRRIVELKEI